MTPIDQEVKKRRPPSVPVDLRKRVPNQKSALAPSDFSPVIRGYNEEEKFNFQKNGSPLKTL